MDEKHLKKLQEQLAEEYSYRKVVYTIGQTHPELRNDPLYSVKDDIELNILKIKNDIKSTGSTTVYPNGLDDLRFTKPKKKRKKKK